jgi:hypothetical protein
MSSLTDTTDEAERFQIGLFRNAPLAKHISLMRSLSQTVIALSRRTIRQMHSHASDLETLSAIVALHYDPSLADHILLYLKTGSQSSRQWKDSMNKPDILMALIPIVEAFQQLGIAYHIGGSVASSAHGIPRATVDVDLVADLRLENVRPLTARLQAAYYIEEKSVRDAISRRACFNLIHLDTMLKVDIFIPRARPYDREVFQRSFPAVLDEAMPEHTFYLETPEDVILAKLEWYRAGGEVSERQWADLMGVLKVRTDTLDFGYLKRWAEQLGLGDLLARAIAEAGFEHRS